jgi:hypothetical protein
VQFKGGGITEPTHGHAATEGGRNANRGLAAPGCVLVDAIFRPWLLSAQVASNAAHPRGARMGFTSATVGAATCVLALLVSSQFTLAPAQPAQQDQTMPATASAPTKSDACTASMDKAYALCMASGFFNLMSVNCDCNQRNTPGAPWECVGTATCKK